MANPTKSYELVKALIVGDRQINKALIMNRGIELENYQLVGVDFKLYNFYIDRSLYKLQLWNIQQSERFRSLTRAYYRGTQIIFVVFDLTERYTFESIGSWFEEIYKLCEEGVYKVIVGILGDKDKERDVTEKEIRECCEVHNSPYCEINPYDSTQIDLMLNSAIYNWKYENEIMKCNETNERKSDEKPRSFCVMN